MEKLSKYLSRSGHDVYIITRRFPGQKAEEHRGKVHVYRVGFLYNRYLRTFTFNKLALFKALRLVRREGIDLIHSHGIVGSFFAALLSMLTKKPLVMTPHGTTEEWGLLRLPLKVMEKLSLCTARKVLFISRPAQRRLGRGRPNALLTIGIDLEGIPKPRERSWKNVRFGYIGRLEEVKGIRTLIEAFKGLPPDRCELLIAGEGPLREIVLESIRGRGNISFLGWQKPESFFQQIDCFVLPSKEKGQPLSILEAMAFGKVIITSLPYEADGKTGIMIRPTQESLLKAMLRVLDNFKECSVMGKNARERSRSLGWDTVVKDFVREYQSAIKRA